VQFAAEPVIDAHTHIWPESHLSEPMKKNFAKVYGPVYKTGAKPDFDWNVNKFIEALDDVQTKIGREYYAWVMALDFGLTPGLPLSMSAMNDDIANWVKKDKRFLAFAGIDPRRGEEAIAELERCVKKNGMRGVKLYPPLGFYPDDEKLYPFYEKVVALQKELNVTLPLLYHQGISFPGTYSKYARPIFLDQVATNFEPDLRIIAAHCAEPWYDELIYVAAQHPSMYVDLTATTDLLGIWPELIAEVVGKAVRAGLSDKIIYGSDWNCLNPIWAESNPDKPYLYLDRCYKAFNGISTPRVLKELGYPEISENLKSKIFYQNANRLIHESP
jgi:predicted TIM-barrel fold metal-dependent hydrolase